MMEKQQCSKDKQSVPALDLQHDIPFPDEIEHLAMINAKLDDALQKADESVTRLDKEYRDAKQYMVEYRGEIDPREMFQNELLLKQTEDVYKRQLHNHTQTDGHIIPPLWKSFA